ncbi:DUF2786 domain-containing protein [Photobacterium kishitanii]|nr:DUF2786 domain-containing protein [Photobacterium kishitanii]
MKKKIDKIKKCLDLGASANEHEAARAIEMAQRLMHKYGICDADVALSGIGEHTSDDTVQMKPKVYVSQLMFALDKAFGVQSIYTAKVNSKGQLKRHAKFIGERQSAMLASYSFDVCLMAIKTARRKFASSLHKNCKPKTKEARSDAFCLGFVGAIESNLSTMNITPKTDELIKTYIGKNYGELVAISSNDTMSRKRSKAERERVDSSFYMGHTAGGDFEIYQPVSGKETSKISCKRE